LEVCRGSHTPLRLQFQDFAIFGWRVAGVERGMMSEPLEKNYVWMDGFLRSPQHRHVLQRRGACTSPSSGADTNAAGDTYHREKRPRSKSLPATGVRELHSGEEEKEKEGSCFSLNLAKTYNVGRRRERRRRWVRDARVGAHADLPRACGRQRQRAGAAPQRGEAPGLQGEVSSSNLGISKLQNPRVVTLVFLPP
jgi:hypothetical protein